MSPMPSTTDLSENPAEREGMADLPSAGRTWAVARYELVWDLRKKRTYLVLALLLFAGFGFGYLLPVIAGKSVAATDYGNFTDNLWWLNIVFLLFNGFISGLFPLLIGGLISTDSFATEFDKNTIVPLLSQPVRRVEVFVGKLVEKFLLLLLVSVLLTALAIATSEVSMGGQLHPEWLPLVALTAFGAFLEYAALAWVISPLLRSRSMALGGLIGLFFGITVGFSLLTLRFGLQEWMFLLPVVNVDSLIYVVSRYLVNPSGSILLVATAGVVQSPANSVSAVSALRFALAGLAIEIVVPLIAGYYFFRRAEVKG